MPKTSQTIDKQCCSLIHGHGMGAVPAPKHLDTLATHDSPTECIVLGQFSIEKCDQKIKNRHIPSFSAYISTR